MEKITINTPFIRLDSFLKLAGLVSTGGQAKILISEGEVKVNGQACLMRGKKLFGGEKVEFEGQTAIVVKGE
ncbi:MAG: RNA-binding S4 domain-containing protein [Clostridia bacterium]|nr:RNA-binding S4 domain-containing protein [Clostridia bacterium]